MTPSAPLPTMGGSNAQKAPTLEVPLPSFLLKKRGQSPGPPTHPLGACPQAPLAANTEGDVHLRGLYTSAMPFGLMPGYPPHVVDEGVLAKLNAHYKFPTWNGQAESWKAFVRDWDGACKVQSATVAAAFMKALPFLEAVPAGTNSCSGQ